MIDLVAWNLRAARPRPVVAGLVLVGLVAGCTSDHTVAAGLGARVVLPSPATTTQDGVTYQVEETKSAAATIDPANPRVVDIDVFEVSDPQDPICAQLSASARVTHQDAHSVVIEAFAYSAPAARTHPCGYTSIQPLREIPRWAKESNAARFAQLAQPYPTEPVGEVATGSPSLYVGRPVRLGAPLGSRTLIDARTGQVIGLATDALPAAPSRVPTGFVLTDAEPFGATSEFDGSLDYQGRSGEIDIRTTSATTWKPAGSVIGQATVQGRPGRVTDAGNERCLSWTDRRHLIRQVCSTPFLSPSLTPAQLTAIAESIPH
jgi:hypothetical protein